MKQAADFINRKACPLCGKGGYDIIVSVPHADGRVSDFVSLYYGGRVPEQILEDALYEIRQCSSCGLLRHGYILNSRLMFQLYETWISREESLNKKLYGSAELYGVYSAEMNIILELLNKPPHETDVLDFGMGWGFWCRMAQGFNFNVTGFELSEVRQRFARKMGVRVIKSLRSAKRYDFINAHHVFEHVPHPLNLLIKLTECAKDGGVIRISVPNAANALSLLFSADWKAGKNPFQPLEHINAFTKATLLKLGEEAGLKEIKGVPESHQTQIYFRKI